MGSGARNSFDVPWCAEILDIVIDRGHILAHPGTSRSAL